MTAMVHDGHLHKGYISPMGLTRPMPAVYLGKVNLHWCDTCDLPLVEKGTCGACGSKGRPVKITPPGDVRPAFQKDLELIRDTIDRQWGEGYGEQVIPDNKVILLNSSPDMDRMDEVVVDGKVRGILRYSLERKLAGREPYVFLIRPWSELSPPERGFVVMDQGAVKPILGGASALAVGILQAHEDIKAGDEVMVLAPEGNVLGSGPSYRDARELISRDRGKGVKVRWRVSEDPMSRRESTWDHVIKANRTILERRERDAVNFIRSKIEQSGLPYAVSYSGGKDSLAVLHLTLEADLRPDLLFVDTGIELPETLENVDTVVKKHGLKLIKADSRDGYWNNAEHFGPSARDYRWCCKTCKLGPTGLLIKEHYPDGLLSFIGQRRYESQNRMEHGATWTNPWVPGQVGASPIQEWTSLHVWLYLFMKDACYNPWYEKGFERIGCWVCPASDMAELDILEKEYPGYHRFTELIEGYGKRKGLPAEWTKLGMWRWLKVPSELKDMLEINCEDPPSDFTAPDNHPRLEPMLKVLGEKEDKKKEILMRLEYCSECGVCVAACPEDALYLDGGINIRTEKCTGCGSCTEKCPVTEYRHRLGQRISER